MKFLMLYSNKSINALCNHLSACHAIYVDVVIDDKSLSKEIERELHQDDAKQYI